MRRWVSMCLFWTTIAITTAAGRASATPCGSDPFETCEGSCGFSGVGGCDCSSTCQSSGDCCPDYAECCLGCTPDCTGKECGDDGCGGTCGSCGTGPQWSCVSGKCICTPYCAGAVCGKDGCGGLCGTCPAGQVCAGGKCVSTPCVPDCTAKQCGDGGCPDQPNACGVCPAGLTCGIWGQCTGCLPQCAGKSCGDDGCGGSRGTCPAAQECNPAGQCVVPPCVPNCSGRECGDDGCSGSCGTCGPGRVCSDAGRCVVPPSVEDAVERDDSGSPGPDIAFAEGGLDSGSDPGSPAFDAGQTDSGAVQPADSKMDARCPPGSFWSYGRCMTSSGGETPGGSGGGCRSGPPSRPLWMVWVLGLAPLLVPGAFRRRRRERNPRGGC